ncbi:MAG: 16S rRNA (guanine(966)-N(2))-methyltransferase RsmD [Candidatus Omnitrophica bacterium]|nr:16S rRNA (guanine(966)-N(2))-methyltransferase RsmD [Candidatus Omnitrophota bacterium]
MTKSAQMRIIGGKFRGRKIKRPRTDGVRPTKDRIREAVFNMIGPDVPGSEVLDLFAGSGSYGLEAISRGASRAVFVEKDSACSGVITENIDQLGAGEESELINRDAERALLRFNEENMRFDIVFCDPPFNAGMARNILIMINHYDILNPSGLLIIEHHLREVLPDREGDVSLFKQRTYKDISISIFLKK